MKITALFLICIIGAAIASPADQVLNKIDALVQASQDEQSQQTVIYLSQVKDCKTEQDFRKQEVSDAKVAIAQSSKYLTDCQVELPNVVSALKNAKSQLISTKVQLQNLNDEYKRNSKIFEQRKIDNQFALDSISQAYTIIQQFKQGQIQGLRLIEVTKHVNSLFKVAVKHKFHSEVVPLIAALVQLTATPASQISSSQLQKVISVLQKLETNVRKLETQRQKSQTTYNKLYQNQSKLLQQQIVNLNSIQKKLKKYDNDLKKCVATESNVLNLANSKQKRNSDILKATVNMCNTQDKKYVDQSKERADYLVLMSKLRSFVSSTIANANYGQYSVGNFINESLSQIKSD